jgi:hypothetical protein
MKSVVIGGYNPEFSSASVLDAAEFDTGWFPLHDKDPVDLDQNGKEDYYLVPLSPCWQQNLENKRFKF